MLITLDGQNRVTLGKLLKDMATRLFDARVEGGKIILEPMHAIPESEAWLYKNKEALASVYKGLDDAKKGKIKKFSPSKE